MSTVAVYSRRVVREAVRRYLRARPDAADTLVGIAQWWFPDVMKDVPILQLKLVLSELVAANELRCTILPDGTELYSGVGERAPQKEPTHGAD